MTASFQSPNKTSGKTMAGIILLIIGGILLVDQLNLFFIPEWLFSWPVWMIGYGIYLGNKYHYRKPIWIWLVTLGTAFLLTENFDNADRFVWPVTAMGLGAWMVLKNSKPKDVSYSGN